MPVRQHSGRFTTRTTILVSLLLIPSLSGCGAASSDSEDGHGHHHGEPVTFAQSVAAIQSRSERFSSNAADSDASLREFKRKKLLEIIESLPAAAADSELKKPQWDRVSAVARELSEILLRLDDIPLTERPALSGRIALLVAELAEMVPLSTPSEFATNGMTEPE